LSCPRAGEIGSAFAHPRRTIKEITVSRTAFYSLDPSRLGEDQQELADLFAQLHALTSGESGGPVTKIAQNDLLLALEAWDLVGDAERRGPHAAAVSRILSALGEQTNALRD
jgi:hypothetical protein